MMFLRTLVLALALPMMAMAQTGPSAEIQLTIRQQLDAFLEGDVARAFSFASPGIQQIFRTPEVFGGMVENGYPMVWRPGEVRMLDLREEGGSLWQRVVIRDADGRDNMLDYQMLPGEDGWRIGAVHLLTDRGLSA
ncbi:DUF4864 domain-containing protein [Mesobacterium pallidum]|uniref:DUF4864 domain-containing protein n=1 Tax=Mesobacterium pallidum TaxID=2872037 RepID=UPI001EE367AB|nr:DUF4864 domain-containing protein [Mesobacterium pallidum]